MTVWLAFSGEGESRDVEYARTTLQSAVEAVKAAYSNHENPIWSSIDVDDDRAYMAMITTWKRPGGDYQAYTAFSFKRVEVKE